MSFLPYFYAKYTLEQSLGLHCFCAMKRIVSLILPRFNYFYRNLAANTLLLILFFYALVASEELVLKTNAFNNLQR